ncbi:MAG: hypothetical protein EZS28_032510 [Streblomastix strix]|uniref:Tyr recombinase domain-containing protein n=1 Tax=Streblomastix strix TaxID=222440 RepID=A0A5J4UNP7_9EUKA|nr:MAG: hypothetical protein EZS28_032510 [Streblomastix strix]
MQGRVGASKRDNNCTGMGRAGMVDSSNANRNTLEGARRLVKRPQGRSMDEEEQSETTSMEDWDFLGRRGEKGEQLLKECLLNKGLTGQSIQGIIDVWHESWKRHACSLTIFAEYWAQQSGTVLQLLTLEQSYLTIANYITYLKPLESDACIIQASNTISTLFELMDKPMNSIKNKVIEYLMKQLVNRATKVRNEIRYWKLSQLMQYISKQATLRDENKSNSNQLTKVSLTLIMVYTVLRMAEVQMAELRIGYINQGDIVIATMTMKKPRGPVEKTLKAAQNRTICSIRWIQSWLEKGELRKEQVWRINRKEKVWSTDKCSKGVKRVLANAGIEGYNITSIRKASISETMDKNMTQIQIFRWSGHSDASATVRVNYDKNYKDIIRNILEYAGKQPNLNESEINNNYTLVSSIRRDASSLNYVQINREARISERIVPQWDRREGYASHPVDNVS